VTASLSTIRLRTVNLAEAQRGSSLLADLAYTQEPGYALEAAARVGARAEFALFEQAGAPVGFAALRIKPIPLLGGGLAYLHGGPATRLAGQAFSSDLWADCLARLAEHCAARKLTLRVASPLAGADDAALAARYREFGFVPNGVDGGRTIVLDLARPLDDIRAGLVGKWRTDLRRGEQGDLRIVRSAEPQRIARLQPLLGALAARKGFAMAQDAAFFARAAGHAAPGHEPFVAHLAYRGEDLVGGHIGGLTGDTAVYLLGATGAAGREARAAFRLQWAVIEYAKERGLARYDLGGIDPQANPDVHRFKARMGGLETARAATWEKPTGRIAPRVIAAAEALRRLRASYLPSGT